ncbi:MAG: hypothetical protein IFK91_00845 [Acidobacteria bacterium]|nr:hypothetical protein [Candidatus Sulfomarinibacter sp. MAG AM1]
MGVFRVVGVGLLMLALVAVPAVAVENDDEQDAPKAEHGDVAEDAETVEHEGEHSSHHIRDFKNEVAVFLGGTDEHGHGTELTWGLDYKRRIAERWAVGVLFDYAGGELRNAVLAPMVGFWPGIGKLQLLAAVGVESHQGRDGGGHQKSDEGGGTDEDATYFLLRLGIAYDIHLGESFGVVPIVNLDFVNNEKVWVYGLAATYGW